MGIEKIKKRLERIEDLPTLPAIAMEVNTMLRDDTASIEQLCEQIAKDQAMVAKILKLVNSAFFGLPSKVGSLSHAVVLLGLNTIQNAVVSIAVVGALGHREAPEGLSMADFWKHSFGVALISKTLGRMSRLRPPDECFVGGLLHDVGKVVLAQFFPEDFGKVWKSVREEEISFYEAEKRLMGTTHAHVGAFLARQWRLPPPLVDLIRCHHCVTLGKIDRELLLIVHAANGLMNGWNGNGRFEHSRDKMHDEAFQLLREPLAAAGDWLPGVRGEMEAATRFFSAATES
jgi:putative nucleotidyltransferase with HDIG domain